MLHVPTPEKQCVLVPAIIPGHVHADLVAAGIIGDPFYRCQEAGCQWVDRSNWTYSVSFNWQPDPEMPTRMLRFDGLDTYADVWLNGELLGQTANMFLPFETDVSDRLCAGQNTLEVRFQSAVESGEHLRREYFAKEGLPEDLMNFDERSFVRKAQYMFGWDWGPRLVSCGIWQPVKLVEFAGRITSFDPKAELVDGRGVLNIEATGTNPEATLNYKVTAPNGQTWTARGPKATVMVDEPELWWPTGFGAQPLYEIEVTLELDGRLLDSQVKRVGFRTVVLRREPDHFGESFEFEVNGEAIWCRGANWIPDHSFPSLVTKERYQEQLRRAVAMNMNMIRVWGGGIYEHEAFYDAADELGLLVWQDFPFACSYVPEDLEFQQAVRQEAEHQVRRLRHRPSLAIWCGNNENSTMWDGKWGGAERNPPRFYGQPIWDEVLPDVVGRLDSGRPYIPTSPVGPEGDANGGGVGDQHYWDAWHGRGDWIHYQDSKARFSSEFGFASSMSMEAWDHCLAPEDSGVATTTVQWHDKTRKGYETYLGFINLHYPLLQDLEDLVYFSQLNQRDAMRFAIEGYRAEEFCKGTLIWQFNDCWPVQSWALMDHLPVWKAAAFEVRRLYRHVLPCIRRSGDSVEVVVANDGPAAYRSRLEIGWIAFDGTRSEIAACPLELEQNERKSVWTGQIGADQRHQGALTVRLQGEDEVMRLLAEPKDMAFPRANIHVEVTPAELVLNSPTPVFDLLIDSNVGQQAFSDNFVSFVGERRVPLSQRVEWVRGRSLGNRRAL